MTRQVIRTTRRIQTTNEDEPIETIHEREVDCVVRNGTETQLYAQDDALAPVSPEPLTPMPVSETAALNSWLRSFQNVMQRQFVVLRDVDTRLTRLEVTNRIRETTPSFERSTWWALWGILMLLLGAALTVILVLIFSSLVH